MNDSLRTGELVSDLMDGRLREQAFAQALEKVAGTEQAREHWHTYHVLGDVLRSGDLAPRAGDAAFLSRLQERLQGEVAMRLTLVDDFLTVLPASQGASSASDSRKIAAANDAYVPWKWVAGLASLVVLVVASWNVVGDNQALSSERQLAQADPTAATAATATSAVLAETSNDGQVMIRDPRLDRLLQAHRQSGGQSALQVPSGFLRSATFEVSMPQGSQK
jgi:sigma-E factor negative regulatory protein RseA